MRNLKFDLDVQANALLCPNPTEFYSKAYISQEIADNFRAVPGIKSSTKIANVAFDNLLKASTCNFTAGAQDLDAVDVDVCAISAMAEICQFDLETSFLANQMAKGSNGDFSVKSFMDYYWAEMSSEINEEISTIMWVGDTTITGTTFLNLCDGFEKKLNADSDVVDVTLTAVTTSNVISILTTVLQALPASLKNKKADLRFYVASNVALAYEIAAAQGNTMAYVTESLGFKFLGIKMVVCEGMTDSRIVLTRKQNMIYAFDGEGDSKELKAINLTETIAEPLIRTRANMKIGFEFTNPTEIVFFH
jgi:hypothetical protein